MAVEINQSKSFVTKKKEIGRKERERRKKLEEKREGQSEKAISCMFNAGNGTNGGGNKSKLKASLL